MLIGSALAHVAGYFGGRIDWLIGRTVDVWMSFPPVIPSLIQMVGLGIGLRNVILARSGTLVSVRPPSEFIEKTPSLNLFGPCIG